jgi:outer membrane receptor protein involved in Fe transport
MSGVRLWVAAAALLAAMPAMAQAAPDPPAADAPAKPAPKPATHAPSKAAPRDKTVDTVTVTGGRPDVETSIDRKSYTLGKDLQATTGSIADALRNLPSVDVDVQGNLSLRGDQNVTILVDGKPAPQFEGKGRADALQQLPADQIERVEVITNPSAALNPEGSGVINLVTRKSRGAGVTGTAYATVGSSSVRRAGASVGYNSPKLNVTASVSGNYQRNKQQGHETRSSLDPNSGQFLDHLHDFVGRNIQRGPTGRVNLTYTPDPKDQLTAAFNYNELLSYGRPFDHYVDFGLDGSQVGLLNRQGHRRFEEIDTGLTGGWKHTFGDGHSLSLDLVANDSRPRDRVLYEAAPSPPAPAFEATRDDATQKHYEARLSYVRPLAGGSLTAGYEWKRDDQAFDYRDRQGASEQTLLPVPAFDNVWTFRQTINTGYATYEHAFGDVAVQAGLRLEDVRWDIDQLTSGQRVGHDYVKAYPSLHVSWKLDDERKLTASYSHRVQRPFPVVLNPLVYVLDAKTTQQGNPDLKSADITSYELGFEQHAGQATYVATLFYRDFQDVFSQAVIDRGNGVLEYTFVNQGSNQAAGLELTASGKLTKALSYNANLTPSWTRVDVGSPLFGGARSAVTAQGRASVNWQAGADDLLQLQANGRGRVVIAQGVFEPFWTLNFGWRHKLSDRVSLTFTAQDLLATNRFVRNLDTPILRDRFVVAPVSRSVLLRFDYRFGGGKARPQQPEFQYDNGGGGGGGPPR